MSTAIATVRAHPDRYENDFDAVVAFLSQNIDKKAPTHSVKGASVTQTRPAKRQKTSTSCITFKGMITCKKSMILCQRCSDKSYMSAERELVS